MQMLWKLLPVLLGTMELVKYDVEPKVMDKGLDDCF